MRVTGADEILQMQISQSLAEIDPQILIVQHAELFLRLIGGSLRDRRECGDPGAIAPKSVHSLAHLAGSLVAVGDGQDFFSAGMALPDQMSNTTRQNGRLACASSRDNQSGP